MAKNTIWKIIAMLLLSLLSRMASADELTDRAKALLLQGKAGEAFQLLDPVEGTRAGDASFDLLLGIAALDSGHNTRAVFALERVLAVEPNNARARAEIARAYLALGETASARQEFETVQKQGVPPEVSANIDRFMDAVDRLDAVTRTTLRGYLEGSLGYDTNVNAATSKGSVAIPLFGGLPFTLADNSVATEAWFSTVGGGVNVRSPINSEVALVGGLSGVLRNNFGASEFDNLIGDAYAGVVVTQDRNVFSLNAQFNQYELASDRYRTASGVSGQWQYNSDASNQLSAFVQYSDLRYPTQSEQNADRWVAGGAMAHAFRSGELAFASAYWVSQRAHDGGASWLGFNGLGVRAGGQMNFDSQTVLVAGGAIEYRPYDSIDPVFLTTRKDTEYSLLIGAKYTPARLWTVSPKLIWTFNDSNIDIYEYKRAAAAVTVRRDF